MSETSSRFTITEKTTRAAVSALFSGAVAIAFSPILVRLSEVGPNATAFWRPALAVPALWLWMAVEGKAAAKSRHPSCRSDYGRLFAVGVLMAADLAVWHWSVTFTSVANATLLANFAPVFVTLGGWLLFGQRVSRSFVLGLLASLVGTTLLVGSSFQLTPRHLWGDALGLISAVTYAAYILAIKYLREEFSTPTIMTWSAAAACATLLPITLLSGESLFPVSAWGWGVLGGLALLSHVAGQGLITYALAYLPAAFSSVGLLVQPVMSALLAWLILKEVLAPWQALGGALVLLGISVARRGA